MEEIEAICLSFVKNTSFISFSRPLFQPFCFQLILCLAFLFIVNSNVEMFIAKALHHHIATSSRQIHYPFDSMMMRCQCYRYKDFVHFSENLCEERQREKKDKTFLFCFFFFVRHRNYRLGLHMEFSITRLLSHRSLFYRNVETAKEKLWAGNNVWPRQKLHSIYDINDGYESAQTKRTHLFFYEGGNVHVHTLSLCC